LLASPLLLGAPASVAAACASAASAAAAMMAACTACITVVSVLLAASIGPVVASKAGGRQQELNARKAGRPQLQKLQACILSSVHSVPNTP
jgi:hypothetical protein